VGNRAALQKSNVRPIFVPIQALGQSPILFHATNIRLFRDSTKQFKLIKCKSMRYIRINKNWLKKLLKKEQRIELFRIFAM
jgi:hypothetical protein